MGDMGELYRANQSRMKDVKARRRHEADVLLTGARIRYTKHNMGQHLIIEGPEDFVDFWPGTAKWRKRGGAQPTNFGVDSLMKYLRGE